MNKKLIIILYGDVFYTPNLIDLYLIYYIIELLRKYIVVIMLTVQRIYKEIYWNGNDTYGLPKHTVFLWTNNRIFINPE